MQQMFLFLVSCLENIILHNCKYVLDLANSRLGRDLSSLSAAPVLAPKLAVSFCGMLAAANFQ